MDMRKQAIIICMNVSNKQCKRWVCSVSGAAARTGKLYIKVD